jgi:hypothetical protein
MRKTIHYVLILVGVALLFVASTSAFAHRFGVSGQVGGPHGHFGHFHHGFTHRPFGHHYHRHYYAPFISGHVFIPFPPAVVVEPSPPVVYVPGQRTVVVAPVPSTVTATLRIFVAPLQTEIYLDGRYIGRAEEFRDGWVQLAVSPGTHTVELRFGTVTHTHGINMEPGTTAVVNDRLS